MSTLFAVAWLLKVCALGKCVEYRAPALYACQVRAAALVQAAPARWKLTANCIVVEGEKLRA